jgi:hypothetical protein
MAQPVTPRPIIVIAVATGLIFFFLIAIIKIFFERLELI